MRQPLSPAVFVDRDGTLIEDVPYCSNPDDVRPFPGVREALGKLKVAGFRVVLITNQSGIGRGWLTLAQYDAVHTRLLELLGAALIDATYYCPDAPGTPSDRRKPAPGMVQEAAADMGIDLSRSWMIGDKDSDVGCGINAGVRAIQVRTGEGEAQRDDRAVFFAEDFPAAVEWLLRHDAPE